MSVALRRLAIAGRGQIAMRMVHAAREEGAARGEPIDLVALHGPGERGTLVVREADAALEIDPADDAGTAAAIVAAEADAVWIGPGLLVDGAALADSCAQLGVATLGSPADAWRRAAAAGPAVAEGPGVPAPTVAVHVVGDGADGAWLLGAAQLAGGAVLAESVAAVRGDVDVARAGAAAVELAVACGHVGPGAVLFANGSGGGQPAALVRFEPHLVPTHVVSELTTGVDAARMQLTPRGHAAGAAGGVRPRGHAIQASLRAELHAGSARIGLLRLPTGPFVCVDTDVGEGDVIDARDPAIATISAWGAERAEALARLRRALAETLIVAEGAGTNLSLLLDLTAHAAVRRGPVARAPLRERGAPRRGADIALLQAAIEVAGEQADVERRRFAAFARRGQPTAEAPLSRTIELRHDGHDYRLAVAQVAPSYHRVVVDGARIDVEVERRGAHERRLTIGRRSVRTLTSALDPDLLVEVDGTTHRIGRDDGGIVRNQAPAVVVSLPVAVGEEVRAGDVVAVVESMKMESSLVAPFAGRVRAHLATPNVQVGARAPLVQLEPLGRRAAREDGAGRVAFTSNPALGRAPVDTALWLLLGYDVAEAEATTAIAELQARGGAEAAAAQQRVLECYADLQALTRPRHEPTDQDALQRSPQEHFHAWLRTLDPETEGLPPHFAAALERALANYGVHSLARTEALEDAAYRLFVAEQRAGAARAVTLAALDCCLAGDPSAAPPDMRATLDRVVQVAARRDPVVSDVAREARWRLFDEPVVEEAREQIYADAAQRLDELLGDVGEARRGGAMDALVGCRYPLVTMISERLARADARQRRALLELMTRRFYRMPSLQGFGDRDGMLTGDLPLRRA